MSNYTGIYRGVITDLTDPAKRGRARLLVPAVLGNAPSGWANPVFSVSTAKVNDQAWVLFENGDLNRPTWITSEPGSSQQYYTEAEIDSLLSGKSDAAAVTDSLNGKVDRAGITAKPVTDRPESYPLGYSVMPIANDVGWPNGSGFGTVETARLSTSRTVQRFSQKTTGFTWVRTADETLPSGWGNWVRLAVTGEAPTAHTHPLTDVPQAAAVGHGHALTDTGITGVLPIAKTPLVTILQNVYPVGALYISAVGTSPATLFGFGSWTAIADRMLIGVGTGSTAPAGRWDAPLDTGGSETVTLTAAQSGLPSHNHTQNSHNHTQNAHGHVFSDPGHSHRVPGLMNVSLGGDATALIMNENGGYFVPAAGTGAVVVGTTATNIATTATNNANTAADASAAHDNMPPFVAVYMWRRTA